MQVKYKVPQVMFNNIMELQRRSSRRRKEDKEECVQKKLKQKDGTQIPQSIEN